MRKCEAVISADATKRVVGRDDVVKLGDRRARRDIICSSIKLARYRPTDNSSVTTNFMPGNQQPRVVSCHGKQGARTRTRGTEKEEFITVLIRLWSGSSRNFAHVHVTNDDLRGLRCEEISPEAKLLSFSKQLVSSLGTNPEEKQVYRSTL